MKTERRLHVAFPLDLLKALDAFATRLGLTRANAIRYCVARTLDAEKKANEPQ